MMGLRKVLLLGGLPLLVTGCSATNLDNFPDTGAVIARADYLDRKPVPPLTDYQEAVAARVKELLATPLTLPAAMEIAMLNDPGLQRHYQDYQIWDEGLVAEIAAAGRKESDPMATSMDWVAARLALMQPVNKIRNYDFPPEYLAVAADFIEVGENVRKAYYAAVAAAEIEAMLTQSATATSAAAELANAQFMAGTTSRREQALQQMVHAETVTALADAKIEAIETREALNRLLLLWGDEAAWAAPERLPALPAERPAYGDLESFALTHRFDTLSDRKSWALWQVATEARSEVRENYAILLTRYDLARYHQETILPLSEIVLGETQKEYNGMLMGIYDLIDDTKGRIEAGRETVEALRDYWIAEAELAQSVGGQLPKQGGAQ